MASAPTGIGTVNQIDFGEVVRGHQSMVFSIAYNFFRDRDRAEDMAQEVFLQLHQSLDSLESPAHVTNWLRRVTANRCIDACRRNKLMPRIGLDEIPEPSGKEASEDPMLTRTLRHLVASLPEKWRALVVLKYQEEMENEEIAETMKMPVGTVKSQLSRALDLLRQKAERVMGECR